MSSPRSSANIRNFNRPLSQRKKVSSCAISTGPSVAIACARRSSASRSATRALISTLRAIAVPLSGSRRCSDAATN
jgi:hypothetical protein